MQPADPLSESYGYRVTYTRELADGRKIPQRPEWADGVTISIPDHTPEFGADANMSFKWPEEADKARSLIWMLSRHKALMESKGRVMRAPA